MPISHMVGHLAMGVCRRSVCYGMSIGLEIVIVLLLILLNGVFALSELALASVRRAREKEKQRALALRSEGQKVIRDVVIPETITVQELAQRMAKVYGRRLSIIQAQELREGSISRRRPDIDKIKKLGYAPKISLDEGLRMLLLGENL